MRRRLESGLRRLWAGEAGPAGWLLSAAALPLELLYGGGVLIRNRLYDAGILPSRPGELPVVSVGNLIVGGAGKTPVSAWLARILAERGRDPVILTRGYGKDEVALHRRWNPHIPVMVDPDRVRGARTARAEGRGLVILDDGFQHRRLRRDLDIVLHPVEDPGRRHLLPGGPFREPPGSLRRADHLILTRRTSSEAEAQAVEAEISDAHPDLPVAHVHLKPAGWADLSGEPADPPEGPLLAVTAIARPRSFARLAERVADARVELMAFPDHHVFSRRESDEIRRRAVGCTVVTTEKDAVRVEGTAHPFGDSARVLRLGVVGEAGADRLIDALLAATEHRNPPSDDPDPEDPGEVEAGSGEPGEPRGPLDGSAGEEAP